MTRPELSAGLERLLFYVAFRNYKVHVRCLPTRAGHAAGGPSDNNIAVISQCVGNSLCGWIGLLGDGSSLLGAIVELTNTVIQYVCSMNKRSGGMQTRRASTLSAATAAGRTCTVT
jgi:hypothetical protein